MTHPLFSFNPHPTAESGATGHHLQQPSGTMRFNPHPTAESGATASESSTLLLPGDVSILTQPQSRVQRQTWVVWRGRKKFQSSPNRRVGCNLQVYVLSPLQRRFQSSPNRRVGCNGMYCARRFARRRFQSSPNRRVGCNEAALALGGVECGVSILTQPQSRVQLSPLQDVHTTHQSFNPHPTAESGATQWNARHHQ